MICKCGAKLDNDSEFCTKCGERLIKAPDGNTETDISIGIVTAQKPKRKLKIIIIAAASLAVLIAAFVLFRVFAGTAKGYRLSSETVSTLNDDVLVQMIEDGLNEYPKQLDIAQHNKTWLDETGPIKQMYDYIDLSYTLSEDLFNENVPSIIRDLWGLRIKCAHHFMYNFYTDGTWCGDEPFSEYIDDLQSMLDNISDNYCK